MTETPPLVTFLDASTLISHGITAQHPDVLIRDLMVDQSDQILAALHELQSDLKNPPIEMGELLTTFERIGLIQTAAELRRLMALKK